MGLAEQVVLVVVCDDDALVHEDKAARHLVRKADLVRRAHLGHAFLGEFDRATGKLQLGLRELCAVQVVIKYLWDRKAWSRVAAGAEPICVEHRAMMREILGVAQDGSELQRRWFHDDYFDLFVWQTNQGETISFQLCYGVDSNERALVWRKDHGWFQDGKTTVEPVPRKILNTVLAPARLAGADATEPIASRFEFAARALPDAIRTAVASRLREFAEQAAVTARRTKVRRAPWQKDMPSSG